MPSRLAGIERRLLLVGVFLMPLAYWWETYDRYVLPKLLVVRLLVIGLLTLFVVRAIVTRTLALKRTIIDIPLLAFLLSALVSTVFAYSRNTAIFGTYARYDGVLTLATYVALFWLSVQAQGGPGDARAIMRVLLVSGYLVAGLAIVQAVTDSMAQRSLVPAFGTLGQKNVLGAFLVMLVPLAYRELAEAASWSSRVIALNFTTIIGVGLLLTLSRSAWLGAGLALVVLAVFGGRPTVRVGVAFLLVALLAGLILGSLRLGAVVQAERKIDELSVPGDRPALWRDTLRLTASRPLVGYGPDNFGLVFPRFQTTYLGPQQWDKAHAQTLQVAATQGVLGVAAYALLLAAFVRAFWRGRRRPGAAAIFAGWVAYQVTDQLNFSTVPASLPFWVFAAAAVESWGATRPVAPATLWGGRWRAIPLGGLVAVMAALAWIGTVDPYLADSRLLVAVTADGAGRAQVARTAATQARALAPQESVYAVEVGNLAFERADWISATQAYQDAARLGTYNPLVYRNLALADRNLGRVTEAQAAARKAFDLDRFDPANRALLAQFGAPP